MKKIYFALSILAILSFPLNGQNIVLEQDVTKDTTEGRYGPNMKNFSHFYIDVSWFVTQPDKQGADINLGYSYTSTFGFRYKRKITNFYAIGVDINNHNFTYRLKQDSSKTFPNALHHDKEKFYTSNVGMEVFNRFNIGKRGNYIGNFLDAAFYFNTVLKAYHFTKDNSNDNQFHSGNIDVYYRKLKYTEPFNYGIRARIGVNRYVLSFSYRLSNLFKSPYGYPELPRITAGIQIGFHK